MSLSFAKWKRHVKHSHNLQDFTYCFSFRDVKAKAKKLLKQQRSNEIPFM